MHPLLGNINKDGIPVITEDDAEVAKAVPVKPILRRPRPLPPKAYCESCGHVDSHAHGCPAVAQPTAEIMPPELAEPPEPPPLVRKALAHLLHAIANRLERK